MICDMPISTGQTITSVSGSVGSVTGAVGSVTGAVGSVTGNVGGSVASVTGNVGGSVASVTGNVGGSVASVGAGGITSSTLASGTITTASIAAGALTGATLGTDFATVFAADAITEAYSTKGGGLTIAKCLYDLHQLFYEMNITVTTQTVLKRDQATTAKTLTLNSATTPTAITEAS